MLLAPAVAVLALVSSQTGFSRYIRYVLPAFPFVLIWISRVARFVHAESIRATTRRFVGWLGRMARGRRKESGVAARESGDEPRQSKGRTAIGVAVMLLLAWSVGSSLWYTPHWMSYFNELAGGPMGGPAHLIDAQVDWGQDLLYLKKWLDAHPEARPLGVVYFGPINPSLAGLDFVLPPKGTLDRSNATPQAGRPHPSPLPEGEGANQIAGVPRGLKPGWYAISVNFLHGYPHYIHAPNGDREWASRPDYSYFRRFQPVATAGYSIYIYHLTSDDLAGTDVRGE